MLYLNNKNTLAENYILYVKKALIFTFCNCL